MLLVNYILSLFCLGLACVLWYQSQQTKRRQNTPLRLLFVISSVVLILAAFYCWKLNQGAEFSAFFVLFHLTWLAWILIYFLSDTKYKHRPQKFVARVDSEKSLFYKLGVVCLAGPVALVASICLSLLVSRLTVELKANQWVLCFMLAPFVWGGLAFWCAASNKISRPLIVITVITIVSIVSLI